MRAFHHDDFPFAARLADRRFLSVSAFLPAKDRAATVAAIVTILRGG